MTEEVGQRVGKAKVCSLCDLASAWTDFYLILFFTLLAFPPPPLLRHFCSVHFPYIYICIDIYVCVRSSIISKRLLVALLQWRAKAPALRCLKRSCTQSRDASIINERK